jgi:hypothetical protein
VTIAATTYEWAQLLAAVAGVVIAGLGVVIAVLVAVMPYARRPRLSIEKDLDGSHSRVEHAPLGGLPHVRLLVSNSKRRRAAKGARVLVEGYTVVGSHQPALDTLGHPSLEWPSATDAEAGAVTVFGGGSRPITLGYLVRARYLDDLREIDYAREDETADGWLLRLTIGIDINDNRDKLRSFDDGYMIRLLVGADDGAARSFTVYIDWNGDPDQTPEQVLASALASLRVE